LRTLDNILSLLSAQKKTQKELTDYIGVSKNVFTDWKSQKNKSYQKHLPKIAEFFDVSVDFLLGNKSIEQSVSGPLSDIELQLISFFRKLPNENQLQALGYIEGIVSTLSNEKNNDTTETA